jgi:hypothetical protein
MEKQIGRFENAMSALPPKADIVQHGGNVRFGPLAEVGQLHSITSSAAVAFAERDYLNASSSIVG